MVDISLKLYHKTTNQFDQWMDIINVLDVYISAASWLQVEKFLTRSRAHALTLSLSHASHSLTLSLSHSLTLSLSYSLTLLLSYNLSIFSNFPIRT